jgi:hypothetical protein
MRIASKGQGDDSGCHPTARRVHRAESAGLVINPIVYFPRLELLLP